MDTFFKKVATLSLFIFASVLSVTAANVDVTGSNPASNNGYPSLSAAFNAINAQDQAGFNVLVTINASFTEIDSVDITGAKGMWSTLKITTSGTYNITSNILHPLLNFDGADNVTIDGRVGQTGTSHDLTFTNASTSYKASTIKFRNDATGNTIKYCNIQGSGNSSVSVVTGIIVFGTTTAAIGNDMNTIDNNLISCTGTNRPNNGIFSAGTAGKENNGLVISNNQIFNIFHASKTSNCILLSTATSGTSISPITISGNHFYETTSWLSSLGSTYNAISISNTSGSGYVIKDNFIGGNSPSCVGTWMNTGTAVSPFNAIYINVASGGTITSIQNNTISGFDWMSGPTPAPPPPALNTGSMWSAVYVKAGDANIGNIVGNTIGSSTVPNSIKLTVTKSMPYHKGLFGVIIFSPGNVICNNNTFQSMSSYNSDNIVVSGSTCIYCIYKEMATGNTTANKNIIGNSDPNYGIHAYGQCITNNATNKQDVWGIHIYGTNSTITCNDNYIQNLINDVSGAITNDGTVGGIYIWGSVSANNVDIKNNFIANLKVGASSSVKFGFIDGILTSLPSTSTGNVVNNIVSLGYSSFSKIYCLQFENPTGTGNIYHNTLMVNGSPSSGAAATNSYACYTNCNSRNVRNNIFFNNRSNSGSATGSHYALYDVLAGTTLTEDFNDIIVNPAANSLAYRNLTTYNTLASFKAGTGKDASSLNIDPLFQPNAYVVGAVNVPEDFKVCANLPGDVALKASVPNDYGAILRNQPTIGAWEKTTGGSITSVTGLSPICVGDKTTYTANGVVLGGGSGAWSSSDTGIATVNPTGEVTGVNVGTCNIRYTVTDPCGASVYKEQSINITPGMVAGAASLSPSSVCLNTAMTNVTHATTGATGIGVATGLPPGVNANFSGNATAGTITISGTPTSAAGSPYHYKIPLTGGCGADTARGTITISTPPVGGTLAGGTALCSGANVSLKLTAYTGTISKWEYSTNGGSTWTDIANTTDAHTATNITQATDFRVLVTSGVCPSVYSSIASVTINASVTPSVTITGNAPVCQGDAITLTANPTNGGATPSYQWKNGVNNIVGETNPTLTYKPTNGDVISVEMVSNAGGCVSAAPVISPSVTVAVNATVTPSVTITGNAPVCQGDAITLTANPTNGGATPSYQWKNGVNNIVGETNPTLTYKPTNGDVISVEMVSNAGGCVSAAPVISPSVTIAVNATITPSVTITGNASVCQGDAITLTANPTNGGATPSYQWKNGVNNIVGETNPTLTYKPTNGDVISVEMVSNAGGCVSTNPVTDSKTIIVIIPVTPSVTISTNEPDVCESSLVQFDAHTQNCGVKPTFEWMVNGKIISSTTDSIFLFPLVDADQVSVKVIKLTSTCLTSNSAVSLPITMTVRKLLFPSVTLTVDSNPVCVGSKVQFTATTLLGGSKPLFQWLKNGVVIPDSIDSTYSYIPTDKDEISVELTSNAGTCYVFNPVVSNSVPMSVTNNIVWDVTIAPDANPVCQVDSVTVTATPINASGLLNYQWLKNSVPIGTNSATLKYVHTDQDTIKVIMSGAGGSCVLNNPAPSKPLVVNVTNPLPASVIIQSDLDTVCQGADVTITATPTNGGTTPTYQWYRNGVAVILSSPTYTFKPNDRDSVYVIMSSNGLKCVSGSPARSNAIGFTVHPLPVISSPALPNLSVYVGDTISPLTVVADSTKSKITYQWYLNKSNTIASADSILGANSSSYLPSTASPSVNYYFCAVRSAIGNCEVFSSIARVEVLQKNILLSTELNNETCNGESDGTIILHISGGSPISMSKVPYVIKIKKLTDVSSPFAPVSHGAIVEHSSKSVLLRTYNDTISQLGGGEYEITITDSLGKQVIDTLVITSPPALAATGSAIQSNPKSKQVAEITVSISGGVPPYKYVWTKGQIVLSDTTLHITNPTSGTYYFKVTDSCSEVVLTFTINESLQPNTFTPNGDGTNDLFYENVFLQIFNRNGILLYEGTSGWDGTFNNQPVQEDTYMYVVKIKSDAEYEYKTGYVTVVR